MTPTHLRANLYKVLDQIARSGQPVEISRNGRTFVLAPAKKTGRKKRKITWPKSSGFIVGDPEELTHFDWSKYWRPMV